MRIIFFLMLMAFITVQGLSQPKVQKEIKKPLPDEVPSIKEMQAQLAEAKREALQQVTDLETDIARAKINNEDPEYIKDMEGQLATMKKMLGVIDEASSISAKKSKPIPPTKTVLPEYKSPLVPIPLKQPVKAPTESQATDKLLWYRGKKINPNTLVTTRGMVIYYDRQQNRVILQPDKKIDSPFYSLAKSLAKIPRMQNDFVVEINAVKNSFFMYPEILETYEEFDLVHDRFYKTAGNTIKLPPMYVGLEALVNQLSTTLNSLPDVSAAGLPPERRRPVCPCIDANIYEQRLVYEQKLAGWLEDFFKEENALLELYMLIHKYLEDNRQSANAAQTALLREALRQGLIRKTQKLLNLFTNYDADNIYFEDGLADATVSFHQQLFEIYIQWPDLEHLKADARNRIEQIKRSIFSNKVFDRFIADQKAQRNHSVVLDFDFYTKHELNKITFDHTYDPLLRDSWEKNLEKYNRFTIKLTLNFNLKQTDETDETLMTADGRLESDLVTISLGRVGCRWKFYSTDPDHRDRSGSENPFYIPFTVVSGTKDYLKDKLDPFKYKGPGRMMMVFPFFRIGFCHPAPNSFRNPPDTMMMHVMRYSEKDLKAYISSHHVQQLRELNLAKEYSVDMLQYVNKMFLSAMETKTNTSQLVELAGKMVKIPNINQVPRATRNAILTQLFAQYDITNQKEDLQFEQSEITHTGKTVISIYKISSPQTPGLLYRSSSDLADPADKDRKVGLKLNSGIVTSEIIHTPR